MVIKGKELVGEWSPPPQGGTIPVDERKFVNQIRDNCRLTLPNLKLETEHDKIMVMVCGGPTAQFYLDEIREKRKDDKYRIFCSNATHDWLIKNDIVPHYEIIIDPKKSKIKDVQNPHKDVEYLIGACVHPGVFEALKDYKVTRAISLSGTMVDGVSDVMIAAVFFDKDDYVQIEGGTMAGLRAMTFANVMGYRTVEFYGFDSGFFKEKDGNPIYYSYKKDRGENVLECECSDGKMFLSTPVFSSQAREFIKWKHRLEWMKFIIHGDSFTAHIDKLDDESHKPKHDLLITEYMLEMNKRMFLKEVSKGGEELKRGYGISGKDYVGQVCIMISQLLKKYKSGLTLLDYGCGQGTFKNMLPPIKGIETIMYDPCIEKHSKHPEPADIVVCTDVLEHVEPECVENVLNDLQKLTKKIAFISICLTPAIKNYSDGRNAHLSLLGKDIWYAKLRKRFRIIENLESKSRGGHDILTVVCQAKEVI